MRPTSLFIAALFVVSASLSAFAVENPAPAKNLEVVSVKGTEVFKVIYQAPRAGKVKLNIYNTESELVFSESFKNTESFVVPVSFAALTTGEYTVELIDRNGKKVEKIQLNRAATKKATSLHAVE
ncbi:MAG: hypothetical protein DI538_07765 [Azospira oryzae]|jgi:hypothetical protein|nr:MAG: hypothetical protein DI538_07765 [Azospira oryzae]